MSTPDSAAARLEGVSKRYGATPALDGLDLSIPLGKVTALLGPNGAGKTTAVSLLLGLTRPDAGHVTLLGGSPRELAIRRRIGVMLQSAALPDTLRVGEVLELAASYYPRPLPLAASARMAGIEDLLRRRYGKLSGGQQRRVQFAIATCGRPELLFLDEPTTGLDVEAREAVWAVIRGAVSAGCAVLLTTHYLEEAEALAQRVAVLMRGRVMLEGTVDEIRAHGIGRRVRCMSRLAVDEVRTWPGVIAISHHDGRLEIEASAAEPIVRRLLAEDPELAQLEVGRASLSEAFRQMTREAA
ncbi:MAG: ABC transporter ATP-binding protein [Steroidobacteraceae bacterium]